MRSEYQQMGAWERSIYICIGVAIGCGLLALFLVVLAPQPAAGHDHGRPDLDSWYPTLTSRLGGPCCDGPKKDATHLDDIDWETTGDEEVPYRVRLPGDKTWTDVPKGWVVHEQNKDGRALVWTIHYNGERKVRCFLPGSLT